MSINSGEGQIEIINGSDKTFIGRIEKGFDFLGYHFSPEGLSMAEKTIEKFLARAVRLYEQEREKPCGSPQLGLYVRRWERWARCTAGGNVDLFFKPPPQSRKTDQTRTKKEHGAGFRDSSEWDVWTKLESVVIR